MSPEVRQQRQKPWMPSKEFYLTNPRSKELRDICLDIVRKLNSLFYDPEVSQDRDRQIQLYSQLERIEGSLIELGIRPNMHVGKPQETFKSSPVITAEYIAGQFIELMGINVVSETDVMPGIQEISETQSNFTHLIDCKNITDEMARYMARQSTVAILGKFLDTEFEDEQPQ